MRRTMRFFEWKEAEWHSKWAAWEGLSISSEYAEGLRGYAERQARLSRALRDSFTKKWSVVDEWVAGAEAEIADPELYYKRMGLSQPTEDSSLPEVVVTD
jgi:hypothetical protein